MVLFWQILQIKLHFFCTKMRFITHKKKPWQKPKFCHSLHYATVWFLEILTPTSTNASKHKSHHMKNICICRQVSWYFNVFLLYLMWTLILLVVLVEVSLLNRWCMWLTYNQVWGFVCNERWKKIITFWLIKKRMNRLWYLATAIKSDDLDMKHLECSPVIICSCITNYYLAINLVTVFFYTNDQKNLIVSTLLFQTIYK